MKPTVKPTVKPLPDQIRLDRKSDTACTLINNEASKQSLGVGFHIINGFPADPGEVIKVN